MAISYNTGATASANNAASVNITIPSGVAVNDAMLLNISIFSTASTTPTVSFSGAGGTWSLVSVTSGSNPEVATTGSVWSFGYAYYRVATSGDPGQVLTISETGSTAGNTWFTVDLVSYTGASTTTPVDIAAGAQAGGSVTSVTFPSLSTGAASDWAVYLGGGGVGSGATLTGPAGSTSRQSLNSSAGIGAGAYDSNGSVGAAGTGIGGGTFHTSNAGTNTLYAFTVALQPPGGAAPKPENPTPPQIPHPLWNQLMEVAQYRAAVAPAVASRVPQTWRLMDGVNGRPGTGSTGTQPPASGTANGGDLVNGLTFSVTQGGMWFQGYWYYVCASGQATAPQKFALWSTVSISTTSSTVVPGSVVTSGTLTAGQWNYVPLPQPLQLGILGVYVATTGVPASAGYPDTASQFGSGQPYSAGITNGPLAAYSDLGASNPAPATFGQSPQSGAGSDPAAILPNGAKATHDNLWLDVQVANTPPAGYNGSYRLWPNMTDADYLTSADAAVNYVIGTEVILSQACYVNAIWYYLPVSTVQFATSADIWRVRDGVRVATQQAPAWCKIGGGKATTASGYGGSSQQWVYTQLPGQVYLPAGDYYVTVYNGNGSPDGWGAKRLGYWQQGGQNFASDGTLSHMPPGANGITNGPLYAPTTPAASPIPDYEQPANVEPGQSVFAVGPPNQVPNRYVGGSSGGGTGPNLFQNYWIDLEVTPASTYQPDAPDLPQRIPHPLLLDLLEVAAYRADGGPPPPVAPGALLSGSGTLTAAVTVTAGTALSGSGSLAAAATVTAPAALSGTGSLSAAAAVTAPAALTGTGTLAATVTVTAPASLSGTGTLAAAGTVTAAAGLNGSGTLSAGVTVTAPASLSGSGSLAATATVTAPASLSGSGSLSASTGGNVGSASLSGSGSLSAAAGTVTAPASLSGSGTLGAVTVITAPALLSGSGTLTAAPVPRSSPGLLMASGIV